VTLNEDSKLQYEKSRSLTMMINCCARSHQPIRSDHVSDMTVNTGRPRLRCCCTTCISDHVHFIFNVGVE